MKNGRADTPGQGLKPGPLSCLQNPNLGTSRSKERGGPGEESDPRGLGAAGRDLGGEEEGTGNGASGPGWGRETGSGDTRQGYRKWGFRGGGSQKRGVPAQKRRDTWSGWRMRIPIPVTCTHRYTPTLYAPTAAPQRGSLDPRPAPCAMSLAASSPRHPMGAQPLPSHPRHWPPAFRAAQ